MSNSTFPQNPQSPQNPYGSQNPYVSQDPQASPGQQYYQHNPQDPLGQQSYPQGPSAAGQVPPKEEGWLLQMGWYRRGRCRRSSCGGQLDWWR